MSFSVIIPSRNATNMLACVKALRQHEPGVSIIWVDDRHKKFYRSTEDDEHAEISRAAGDPYVDHVTGIHPFVFARNVNLGIKAALGIPIEGHPSAVGAPFDAVVLLNDDALLMTPGGFTALAALAAEHPEYGVIAAACDNTGNRNQCPKGIGLREDPRMVCFVCVYIPCRTIERVGMLDERYVGYGMDDDDYCFSVRKAGLKVGIFDHCIVDHRHLTSSYRGNPRAPSDFRPNMKLFIEKWGHDNWGVSREVALRRWGLA